MRSHILGAAVAIFLFFFGFFLLVQDPLHLLPASREPTPPPPRPVAWAHLPEEGAIPLYQEEIARQELLLRFYGGNPSREEVLLSLAERKWFLARAKREGIRVSPDLVARVVEEQRRRYLSGELGEKRDLDFLLRTLGLTPERYFGELAPRWHEEELTLLELRRRLGEEEFRRLQKWFRESVKAQG